MIFQHIKFLCSLIVIFCISISNSNAATQGSAGTNSSGTVDIAVIVNQLALIRGLTDINLGLWPGSGDLTGTDDICVAISGASFATPRGYHMRASGDGSPGLPADFTLSNGVSDINYRVFLNHLGGRVELLAGQTAYSNQFQADFAYVLNFIFNGCFFPNATIEVLVEESELATGLGTHSGTLTLELIPE